MKIRELLAQMQKLDLEKEIYVFDEPQNTLDGLPALRPVSSCCLINERDISRETYEVATNKKEFAVLKMSYAKSNPCIAIPEIGTQELIVRLADRLEGEPRQLFLTQSFGLDSSEMSEDAIYAIYRKLNQDNVDAGSRNDEFVVHEALDRTYQILDQLQRSLSDNRFVQNNAELRSSYEASVEGLADLYQLIGAKACD
ncbi:MULTISPECIES: hypothetical protein [unclassified Oleiphilus]|uniref:hypothetical protein n=2 Tax=Oleiphilus TaxID=141450 RepID=UPI0007C30D96|nr:MULTISPECIES: hypothetical protein [unclassified Oleiphilus]KZY42800.1 hypothetical protein A3732_15660 [Oleiphilus sp. HI0050]KZY74416.1 hypothetical protein A3740_16575 [Oleiphilus sp. HI0068]KZY80136.1 hypothetical protein A3741_05940 [Oleiphilus sp. HI0069]KZZ30770.1 hypothetical protein A3755_13225 [Oleiphilus sp. HI0085]KZZ31956.1 hypothetical protein A3756_06295 [Oleiphilus sp. HI0086]